MSYDELVMLIESIIDKKFGSGDTSKYSTTKDFDAADKNLLEALEVLETFNWVKILTDKCNLTQTELSELSGVHQSKISRVINLTGAQLSKRITLSDAIKLMRVLFRDEDLEINK
ncbi:helix-turn-helix domain-containing protein [Balneola sp. MJW-20]|uniref:helix-turn-helix domain-containing protein n=1 Tax=Gracilimonas aurantiaca TaxID=3234185 RepID=UPI003465EEEA